MQLNTYLLLDFLNIKLKMKVTEIRMDSTYDFAIIIKFDIILSLVLLKKIRSKVDKNAHAMRTNEL